MDQTTAHAFFKPEAKSANTCCAAPAMQMVIERSVSNENKLLAQ